MTHLAASLTVTVGVAVWASSADPEAFPGPEADVVLSVEQDGPIRVERRVATLRVSPPNAVHDLQVNPRVAFDLILHTTLAS